MDVDTAFRNAEVKGKIYIKPPEDFSLPNGMACFRLIRALYGLKQSPREWYNNINSFLHRINFKRLESEPCLYCRQEDDDDTICLIVFYVDDLVIAGSNAAIVTESRVNLRRIIK